MRRFGILFCLLFVFLKLSAVALPDTVSLSATTSLPAIVVHPENLPVRITTPSDTTKFKIDFFHIKDLKLSVKTPGNTAAISAQAQQRLKEYIKSLSLDSLKSLVKTTTNDSSKALFYTEIAHRYLDYDTISDKRKRLSYEIEALNFSMKALHFYSVNNDTTGLRMNFDNLANIYFSQKKYVQAKWFILQSNSLSRAKKDVPNIITSLVVLSAIKTDIKDYKLAKSDLDEALQLSAKNHLTDLRLDVLKKYAMFYSRQQDYAKEALMLKKRDSLQESIHKKEQAELLAKATSRDSLQKKRLDSVQNKKKVYTSNTAKSYKNSRVKTVSL